MDLFFLKVAINDKEKDLIKYKNEFNISFSILMDENGSVTEAYRVRSTPDTFFISREGKIVGRALKEMDWTLKAVTNLIQSLLKEKK